MGNPRTRTTKTYASLLIVARAVDHIRRTGERVVIVTPSSANKATALRDAVLRAYETGLADPEHLRILCVVPAVAAPKLWHSGLTADPALRHANPLIVADTREPGDVKHLARSLVDNEAEPLFSRHGVRLWHTLDLRNYAVADAVRALFERDELPAAPRVHAHSVSSAFGLLGHHHGRRWATGQEYAAAGTGYLLVQHLGTPDMVSSLYHDRFDYRPRWTRQDGMFVQRDDPHFPQRTYDPAEELDSTFYTRTPVTSERMNAIIRRQGGGGIVVSLAECLDRYPYIRDLLAPTGTALPADPRRLREWSLVMAVTGVLNALDRSVVDTEEVLIHASGSYGTDDYRPVAPADLVFLRDPAHLREVLHTMAAGRGA